MRSKYTQASVKLHINRSLGPGQTNKQTNMRQTEHDAINFSGETVQILGANAIKDQE